MEKPTTNDRQLTTRYGGRREDGDFLGAQGAVENVDLVDDWFSCLFWTGFQD